MVVVALRGKVETFNIYSYKLEIMGLPYEVRGCIGDVLEAYDRLDINGPKPVLEAFKHFSERYNSDEFQKYLQRFAIVASAIARHNYPSEDVNPYLSDKIYLPTLKSMFTHWITLEHIVRYGGPIYGQVESMEFKIALCMLATELLTMDGLEAGLDQEFLDHLQKIE
ncbi:hypothetical protein HYX09_05210 [Candidatus Woesearchaeota archaeon]|nr:hypothetical protein [Candidatus Woesearchaeota archaeon]MBI2661631.1 hypothetical protein [Candidatus Woesearchaeota archaeon]